MRRGIFANGIVVVAAAAALCFVPADTAAQGRGGGPGPNAETPRTADGKPDLSGVWAGGRGGTLVPDADGNITVLSTGRPCHPAQECAPSVNFERDSGVRQRMDPNKPVYKPEYWERVEFLDVNGNAEDPDGRCYPEGLPRIGAPSKIVQTDTELIFMYTHMNTFRVIPIDGREHHPIRSQDLTYYGDSVGEWEGDTMVIDSVGFTDWSWLAWPGYLHSNNMRVVERITREGNSFTWQATVYDDYLTEPWVMNPERSNLNPDPQALLTEDLPCEDRDLANMYTRERG